MLVPASFLLCVLLLGATAVYASPASSPFSSSSLIYPRGQPVAPDGYAPAPVDCPSARPTVRAATGLSPQEQAWLELRANNTASALRDFLVRANISGLDVGQFTGNTSLTPRIAIALSGGGYRAQLNGAGALAAFDNRSSDSTSRGQLGGLLQAATYLSGLSGGSWAVGSLYTQNFTSVESIIEATSGFLSTLWQLNATIFEGPQGISTLDYYRSLQSTVQSKVDAGFNKTITDYWGRSLSYQLVNASDGGPAYTFSSIANDEGFSHGNTPMPIIVSVERPLGTLLIPENSTIFEFNPWEMGSFDPTISAFAPLEFVGTDLQNDTATCIAGFDNVGFVMGTSSSLFNQAFLLIQGNSSVPNFLLQPINDTLAKVGEENRDIATWPNPFFGYNVGSNPSSNSSVLTLVDGGEDLQNVPLHPLLLTDRQVDVILAVDSSADTTTNWPNGTSLVATYQRFISGHPDNSSGFPPIPDVNTFVNLGLNARPTFFGCNVSSSSNNASSSPLIVYLPNTPYAFLSNFSTFNMQYSTDDRNQVVTNGYNVATRGNGTEDSEWMTCLSCAILLRSFGRSNSSQPAACTDCLARYCWNGTLNDTTPATFNPSLLITESGGARSGPDSVSGLLLSIVAVWCCSMFVVGVAV